MNIQNANTAFAGATVGGLISPTLPAVVGGAVVALLFFSIIEQLRK